MHYEDLKPYKLGDKIYPNIINIGWLDKGIDFNQGDMSQKLTDKLFKLTMFDLDQKLIKNEFGHYVYMHPNNIIMHDMHMRGSPFECPLCGKEIDLIDEYGRVMTLGRNEMYIPAVDGEYSFDFSTLLYHYIAEHKYLPPQLFLDALDSFDLSKPYNCLEE